MKRFLLFALTLVMFSVTGMADDILNRVHPNEASYKIEGDFSYRLVNNNVQYELTNVVATGLQINQQNVYVGSQPDGKEVMFTFDHIVADDPQFPGFDNIAYWYYDPDIADWQPDIEIRKGERSNELQKDITIVLIIDCSNSLKNDFLIVKNATLHFLHQMYEAAPNGNVHIGIVGFSSMPDTKILPIQPLTTSSYNNMQSFIRSLTINNGTALFYAWDKAVEATYQYINSGKMQNYDKSHFITFTDGIDQTSQDLTRRPTPIVSTDDYYNYIIKTAKNKIANYESDVVFVKGTDITNQQQQVKFENKLSQLAVPNDRYHYERLESISRLANKFSEIANRLTDSWQVLNCYVAPARHGRVCWTFGKKEVKPTPAPTPTPAPAPKAVQTGYPLLIGASFGLGVPMEFGGDGDYMSNVAGVGMDFQFAFDFAYPISDRFGMGFYTSIGGGFTGGTYDSNSWYSSYSYQNSYFNGLFKFSVGLLMEMGDLDERPFLLGISPCIGFGFDYVTDYLPLEIRFGRVFRNNMYMTGDITFGVPLNGVFFMEPSIHIGYNFGHNVKK